MPIDDTTTTTDEKAVTQAVNTFDASDPQIPDVFSNTVFAAFGSSDITLTFAQHMENGTGGRIKPGVRITMTHQGFMDTMKFLITRYKFFDRVYKNRSPNLFSGDPKELQSAFDEMIKSSGGGE